MKFRANHLLLFSAALLYLLAACTAMQAAPAAPAASNVAAASKEASADTTTETVTETETATETTIGPMATVTATAQALEAKATGVAAPIVVMPLDPTECEAIHTAIVQRLGVAMEVTEKDFASDIANRQGTACTISATGTGKDFGNFVDTAQAIREALTKEGWTENPAYAADGPTGTASGYEKENKIALAHVDWQPSAAVQCPADQPIAACDVEPSQQNFTVVIQLAQTSPPE